MAKELHCPKCGATQVARHRQGTTFFGTPRIYLTCLICGRQWQPGGKSVQLGGCGCLLAAFLLGSCVVAAIKTGPNAHTTPQALPDTSSQQKGNGEHEASKASLPIKVNDTPMASRPIAPIFSDPEAVARALTSFGFVTGEWKKNVDSSRWTFLKERQVTTGEAAYVGDIPNDITYFGESSRPDCVERVTLTANVFNVRKEEPVLKEFALVLAHFFEVIKVELPKGLTTAITAKHPFARAMDFGDVVMSYEPYKSGYGLKVVIEPAFEGRPRRVLQETPPLDSVEQPKSPEPPPVDKETPQTDSTERPFRTWTDNSGRYTVEAQFMGAAFGKVKLRKRDGQVVTVPIENLSEADQLWIKRRR